MSSLAATQADGYYVPPEYFESGQYKHKSRNQFAGSKGHNQYLQKGVVRFELPYDGFCQGCGAHVGRGTRFNAQKTKGGSYFTTTIWEFQMSCRACAKTSFVVRTNPKERGFDYVEGIHKQEQEFDTKDAGTAGFIETEDGNKLVSSVSGDSSGLARLESVASGKRKAMTEHDELRELMKVNSSTFFDDANSNAALRSTFRVDRRAKKRRLKDAAALGWKEGMELVDELPEDVKTARKTCFRIGKDVEQDRFRRIRTSSIFDSRKRKGKLRERVRASESFPERVLSSASISPDVPTSQTAQERDGPRERTRIRVARNGSTLVTEKDVKSAECARPPESTPAITSSLAALADYGSDTD